MIVVGFHPPVVTCLARCVGPDEGAEFAPP